MLLLWHDEFKRNNNLEKNVKMKFKMYLIAHQPCVIVILIKTCYCKCLFTSCDKKVNWKPIRKNLIRLKL